MEIFRVKIIGFWVEILWIVYKQVQIYSWNIEWYTAGNYY